MSPLERLLAIEEIKQLKAQYATSIDSKDWETMEALWTEDGIFDARLAGPPGAPPAPRFESSYRQGRESIMEFYRSQAEGFKSVHIASMPTIQITGDRSATGTWILQDFCEWRDGEPYHTLRGVGRWHDTYELLSGRWLIKTSVVTRQTIEVS